ncbi:hypothetical protein AUC70_11410 [Methyloceanibacter stevinii]|uniref:Uncharacterized protein n=1 Tax=Methyloceanibacter stevinii TaxID=1774970 RepID=A0A1E3VIY0_9HYPH|nr:hypothetical protein [Methyloceanibacter stevinii]ODR93477.1 hypothetical protein AUC70_11410 [Methyloceanibacter stevinii]
MNETINIDGSEDANPRPKHFHRFRGPLGFVRLVFDGTILLLVMLIIGFIVFANGLAREPKDPPHATDGITVLTGGVSRIDEAMKLMAKKKARRMLITGVNRETTLEQLKLLTPEALAISTAASISTRRRSTRSTTRRKRPVGWRRTAMGP